MGQAYRVIVSLHESAGTAATIVGVDLTFTTGATTNVSAHFDQPISDAANVCPANGSVDSRELVVVDADATHSYATTAQAKVTFTDSSTAIGTTTGSAGVPALPAPPAQTFILTGLISDMTTRTGIAGAKLDVLTGANAGKSAVTDSTGTYVMRELVADNFRLRASASDYDSGEQGVTVPAIPRADFLLGKSCAYTVTPSSAIVPDGPFTGTVTVTPTTANTCPWTASTPDAWIALGGATSGSGPGSLSYFVASPGSAAARTASIIVAWSSGNAAHAHSASGELSTADHPERSSGRGRRRFVNVGASCYFRTTLTIDVPWIHITGTMEADISRGSREFERGRHTADRASRSRVTACTADYLRPGWILSAPEIREGVQTTVRQACP